MYLLCLFPLCICCRCGFRFLRRRFQQPQGAFQLLDLLLQRQQILLQCLGFRCVVLLQRLDCRDVLLLQRLNFRRRGVLSSLCSVAKQRAFGLERKVLLREIIGREL
jgi:hypothetical protein